MKHELIVSNGGAIVDPNGGIFQPLGGSTVLQVEANQLRNGNAPFHGELQYLGLLQELVDKREEVGTHEDRTGVGTTSVFGRQIRFNLEHGFPLLTTKKTWFKGIVAELLWMLSGSTDASVLQEQGVHIWDEWCKDGTCDLGPVYGKQWRSWPGVGNFLGKVVEQPTDQIKNVITSLAERPHDRGHIVTAWNPAQLKDMALRPCHCLFQFYVEDNKLSCQLYQRSADIFLGVPFNIASYALLTHLIAEEVGLGVGDFVHTFGDLHLYSNHLEQAKEQVSRNPFPFPEVKINGEGKSIFKLELSDFELVNYQSHPKIEAEVAV